MACMEHDCRSCGHQWFDNSLERECPNCGSWDTARLFDEDAREYVELTDDCEEGDDGH